MGHQTKPGPNPILLRLQQVIKQDCTLGLVIQIFNGSYDAGVDVVFPHSMVANKASCDTLSKAFLKSMKTW